MTPSNESSGAVVREHVTEPVYISDTSPSDCQLCGEGKQAIDCGGIFDGSCRGRSGQIPPKGFAA